ncbi:MAG: hypothetical protein HY719_00095 [Planctomycetes bacterium]|nr:hypothetical protein [Planctomycetota bacterium]
MSRNQARLVLVFAVLLAATFSMACLGGGGSSSLAPLGPKPSAPTGLAASAGDRRVDLTWTAATGAATYTVYRDATPNLVPSDANRLAAGVTAAAYADTSALNDVTYYYAVTAASAGGEGAASAVVSARPTSANVPPVAPDPVSASATSTAIRVTWTAVTGATSYRVYRSSSPNVPIDTGAQIADVPAPATSYDDAAATPGNTYFYVVRAVNAFGASQRSNIVGPVSRANALAAPTGLTATAGNAKVDLSWTAVSGATAYKVYRSNAPAPVTSGALLATVNAPTVTYSDATAVNGTLYYYVVTTVGGPSDSGPSNEVSATPAAGGAPPTAPTALTATPGNGRVDLSWTASAGATTYNVYRATAASVPITGTPLGVVSAPVTTYADTTVTNGTTYFYVVTAVNASGQSAASNEVSAAPTPGTGAPPAPTGLVATGGNAQVSLSWTAAGGATSYRVYRATAPGVPATGTPLATVNAPTVTYTDATATNGTTYYYVVTAVNAGGASAASNEANATPTAPGSPPSAPTGLVATAGAGKIDLSWNSVSGAVTYKVWRGTAPGVTATGSPLATVNAPTVTYSDATAANGTTYYYVVTAENANGASVVSNEASATVNALPVAPTGLTATAGNAFVLLKWTGSAGATGYRIYRATAPSVPISSGGGTPLYSGVKQTSYVDGAVTSGTTYYYVVTAVNGAGESGASNEVSATPTAAWKVVFPFGTTNTLWGLWGSGPFDVYAVGYNGVILRSLDGGASWDTLSAAGSTAEFKDVWGPQAGELYVVGASGTILKSVDGATFTASPSGTTQNLEGVFGAPDASAIWAVGAAGTIQKSTDRGVSWTAQGVGAGVDFLAVWAYDAQNVFAVGKGGKVYATTNGGAAWSAQTSNTTKDLHAVFGVTDKEVYASGDSDAFIATTNGGAAWSVKTIGSSVVNFHGAWAPSSQNVIIGGTSGKVYATADGGATFTAQASNSTARFEDMWGFGASDVWGSGSSGTVMHWGGSTWANKGGSGVSSALLWDIQVVNKNSIYVVGDQSTILHFDGNTWVPQTVPSPPGPGQRVWAVWGSSDNFVWSCGIDGASGAPLVLNTTNVGATWGNATTAANFGTVFPFELTGFGATDVWIVGGVNGPKVRRTLDGGTTWSSITMPASTPANLNRVFGPDADHLFIAADAGKVYATANARATPPTWTSATTNTTKNVLGVWGSSLNNMYCCDDGGGIFRSTNGGTSWSAVTSGVTTKLWQVWGDVSGAPLYAVGASAKVLKSTNGTTFTAETLPASVPATAEFAELMGTSGNELWVVGLDNPAAPTSALILRYR